jgi:hypothetical protein
MVAYAMHLLRTTQAREVLVHPDGEHGKRFDFAGWLAKRGLERTSRTGKTSYAGLYVRTDGRSILVNPVSGKGDVVADVGGAVISAECKGGIINTRHSGQVSRLYKGLCETVGLLMAVPSPGRQVAVVPRTESTHKLALRLAPRCAAAGIEIALVGNQELPPRLRGSRRRVRWARRKLARPPRIVWIAGVLAILLAVVTLTNLAYQVIHKPTKLCL